MIRKAKSIFSAITHALGLDSKYIGSPKGIKQTKDWCATNNAFYRAFTHTNNVDAAKAPVTSDAKSGDIFSLSALAREQQTFVATLSKGRVWGANGAVITDDDYLLEDVSREFGRYGGVFGKEHSVFGRLKLGKPTYYDCNVAVLSTVGCNNYYHWMIDVLPRIAILEEAGVKDSIDLFVIDYTGLPFQTESLQKAGILPEKIIRSNDYWKFHIQVKQLFVPSLSSTLSSVNGWQVNWLRNIFADGMKKADNRSSKIYISRKKAGNRKLLNESELITHLQSSGYIVHYPEDHSIEENAAVFASAATIVSLHGAGNTNWLFAAKGTKIVEIFPPKQVYPNYWYIAALLDHRYAYIINEGERLQAGEDPVMNKSNEDSRVSVAAVDALMNELC